MMVVGDLVTLFASSSTLVCLFFLTEKGGALREVMVTWVSSRDLNARVKT